jgi:hypothetical protein
LCEWSPKPFSKGAPALSANAASEYLTQLDIINIEKRAKENFILIIINYLF